MDKGTFSAIALIVVLGSILAWYWWTRRDAVSGAPAVTEKFFEPFSDEEHRAFIRLVAEYFADRNLGVAFGNDFVRVESDGLVKERTCGLSNVAQKCHLCPRAEWRKTIEDHFDQVVAHSTEYVEFERKKADFDAIADLLKLRIYPDEYVEPRLRQSVVYREDLPGTMTTLVLDSPGGYAVVNRSEAEAWRKSDRELFDLALKQSFTDELIQEHWPDRAGIFYFFGGDFTAVQALSLRRFPQCIGKYGALVGIPNRHVLFARPIDDQSVTDAIMEIIPCIQSAEERGPGSITANLFWYNDGQFIQLPYTTEKDRINLAAPSAFKAMLKRLPESGAAPGDDVAAEPE